MTSPKVSTVLIIDDDALALSVIAEFLEDVGIGTVLHARGGMNGLKYIHDPKVHIDLILCDWHMPGVDGLTVLKALKNSPHREKERFIMVSGDGFKDKVQMAIAAGANGYLVKPFKSTVLKEKIWSVMNWPQSEVPKVG